jgi:hypothetical protein
MLTILGTQSQSGGGRRNFQFPTDKNVEIAYDTPVQQIRSFCRPQHDEEPLHVPKANGWPHHFAQRQQVAYFFNTRSSPLAGPENVLAASPFRK